MASYILTVMANILPKVIKLKRKEFQIKTRLLGLPKGSLCYLLKTDGTTKPFTILATFDVWMEDFNKYRHSKTMQFAVSEAQEFQPFGVSRTMRHIAKICSHIALVHANGESQVYTVRNGDDWLPYYFDWTYTLFVTATADTFDPQDNQG